MPGMYEDEYRRAYHRAYQNSVMADGWVESHDRIDREVRASLMQMRASHLPEPFGVPADQLLRVTGSRRQTPYRTAICYRCGYQRDSHGVFFGDSCVRFVKPPRSVTFRHHPVDFPMIFVLGLGVGALYRLIKHVTKNTAISWYEGHVAICSWLRDTGEMSRADGIRVLGAVGYLGFWLVTCVVWAISLVSAVLL